MPKSTSTVSAREAYQVLKDLALGIRAVQRLTPAVNSDGTLLGVDGWQITLITHQGAVKSCLYCEAPDGRTGSCDTWQRFGTDPVSLLSAWEQAQVEALL